MGDSAVFDITRQAMVLLLVISAPPLLIAMIVGLIISLVQALTQVQEATIAFVPKILILFASFLIIVPYMTKQLLDFTLQLRPVIIAVGGS
jgi:flagellar biosynthesis protein FliQ